MNNYMSCHVMLCRVMGCYAVSCMWSMVSGIEENRKQLMKISVPRRTQGYHRGGTFA